MNHSNQARQGEITVYADGSCLGNPGPGGWGVVIVDSDGTREYSGGDPETTNNRMEITAAIEALRRVAAGSEVLVRSDSQYVVNTINSRWKRNANTDLWRQLDEEIARRKVRFQWVRGHAGDALNERADRLALEEAKAAAERRRSARRAAMQSRVGPAPANPPGPPPATTPVPRNEVDLKAVLPLLKEGETVRRCLHCGGEFIAPARYKDSFCALVACQLQRRSRPGSA